MKNIFYTLIVFLFTALSLSAQLYNLSFVTDKDDDPADKLNVFIYLSFDNPAVLADSNFPFFFDETVLDNPVLISSPLNAAMYNYNQINLTEPGTGLTSFNVISNASGGMPIAAGVGNDSLIAHIQFDVIDNSSTETSLTWQTSQIVIFDEDFDLYFPGDVQDAINLSLPVELTYFQASRYNDNSATLEWEAAMELDFSHYELERSMDGRTWNNIAKVQGAALNTFGAEYSYLDSNIPLPRATATNVYYRLRMVDNDGAFEYSDIRTVGFESQAVEIEVYPNPTANVIRVDSEFPVTHVSVFDVDGKLVIDQDYLDAELDLKQMTSGLYRVVITTEAGQFIKTIVKIN